MGMIFENAHLERLKSWKKIFYEKHVGMKSPERHARRSTMFVLIREKI